MIAIIATMLAAGAAAQPPQFEVASIKPAIPGALSGGMSGGPGTKDPGLFNCENVDLLSLVTIAFDIPGYRLTGPDWMRSARFNISAKIPEGTTKDQFKLMQQNLLVERFKMTFHHEQKEMQIYDLVVAKGGPKLTSSPDAPPPADANAPKPPPGPSKLDKDGFPLPYPGRTWTTTMAGRRTTQPFFDATMEQLARYLESPLGRSVHDATGLQGKYDFVLKWVMDWGGPPTEDSSPTIFEALQTQLGLKLEPKKGPVDVLIIDHIDKTPSDN